LSGNELVGALGVFSVLKIGNGSKLVWKAETASILYRITPNSSTIEGGGIQLIKDGSIPIALVPPLDPHGIEKGCKTPFPILVQTYHCMSIPRIFAGLKKNVRNEIEGIRVR